MFFPPLSSLSFEFDLICFVFGLARDDVFCCLLVFTMGGKKLTESDSSQPESREGMAYRITPKSKKEKEKNNTPDASLMNEPWAVDGVYCM